MAIGSRTNLRIVQATHRVEQVQYVEPQEDHNFLASASP